MVVSSERCFITMGLILSGCTAVGRGNLKCSNPLVLNIRIYVPCVVDSTKVQLKFLPRMCQLRHIILQNCLTYAGIAIDSVVLCPLEYKCKFL
jgi:hypothetical protein